MIKKSAMVLFFAVLALMAIIQSQFLPPEESKPFILEGLKAACWPGAPTKGISCTLDSCTLQNTEGTFRAFEETVNTYYGSLKVVECVSPKGSEFKALTSNYALITEDNYALNFGAINSSEKAYLALITLKHPDQLSLILSNPRALEVWTAHLDPYLSDLENAKKNQSCAVNNELEFTDLPKYAERGGEYFVERVFNKFTEEGAYYHETATLTPQGRVTSYSIEELFKCA